MEYVIQGRHPSRLFRFFEEISAIPRGSYHEEAISEYLVNFAKVRGYEVYRDAAFNVLIKCPATPGYEDRPTVLLQGHTDMVCEKNADVLHDFEKDGIQMYVDGKYLRARGTTLGADDGFAVAAMLCILAGQLDAHPALECLFTTAEEVGLDGARAFDYSRISARRMINLDSESESEVTAGCAGGLRSDLYIPCTRTAFCGEAVELSVTGLAGGHSGENINSGRANANKLMGRVLAALGDFHLISLCGGSKDNAIPRECTACIAVDKSRAAELTGTVIPALAKTVSAELWASDAGFSLTAKTVPAPAEMLDRASTVRVVGALSAVQNGVIAMSEHARDFVEFSRSLGVTRTEGDEVRLTFSSRSAKETQLDASVAELEALAATVGGYVKHHGRYPGWDFVPESPLRDAYLAAAEGIMGKKPEVTVIHAGLECGIISSRLPGIDIISVGPDMHDIHSPDEALDLDSAERVFRVLAEVLKN